MNLIYALNESDKIELISRGFSFINEQLIDNNTVYIFANDGNKSTFSESDKSRFLFCNKMNI